MAHALFIDRYVVCAWPAYIVPAHAGMHAYVETCIHVGVSVNDFFNIGCTGNQPLVSGFHFSVLDYQMWSNSNDTTIYRPGSAFGEDSDNETLISYEGRIGADYYRGWCSEFNPSVQPFLQIDFKREVIIRQVETQGLQLNLLAQDAARYIRGFWLEYSTNITTSFVNVTLLNSSVAKVSVN